MVTQHVKKSDFRDYCCDTIATFTKRKVALVPAYHPRRQLTFVVDVVFLRAALPPRCALCGYKTVVRYSHLSAARRGAEKLIAQSARLSDRQWRADEATRYENDGSGRIRQGLPSRNGFAKIRFVHYSAGRALRGPIDCQKIYGSVHIRFFEIISPESFVTAPDLSIHIL